MLNQKVPASREMRGEVKLSVLTTYSSVYLVIYSKGGAKVHKAQVVNLQYPTEQTIHITSLSYEGDENFR